MRSIVVGMLLLGGSLAAPPSPAQERPASDCLAHERIGILVGETFSTFRDFQPGDHTLSLREHLTANLRSFGAKQAAMSYPGLQVPNLQSMSKPLDELSGRGGTLMLAFSLDAKEVPLINEYLHGDQYPLRTVKILLSGWIIDVSSRDVLAQFNVPRNYAAYSTDEAVSKISDEDLAAPLSKALATACQRINDGNVRQRADDAPVRPGKPTTKSSKADTDRASIGRGVFAPWEIF